ncbi:MAG: hypothetical protein V1897_18560 [Pseudomonadota bacterium]
MDYVDNSINDMEMRCPKLGGPVTFAYCLVEAVSLPCSRALMCWNNRFDAISHFQRMLGAEEFRLAFQTPPKSRMDSILELIERAKKPNSEASE